MRGKGLMPGTSLRGRRRQLLDLIQGLKAHGNLLCLLVGTPSTPSTRLTACLPDRAMITRSRNGGIEFREHPEIQLSLKTMTAALPSRFPAGQRFMVSLAILLGFAISPSSATAMDTGLVLMVDTNVFAERLQPDPGQRRPVLRGPDLPEFGAQRQAGKMAASVFPFKMPGEQVGTPWMELSSAQDMNFFAQNIRNILYPNAGGDVNCAAAISTGASQLNGNSFTGTNRQITLIDDATGSFKSFYLSNVLVRPVKN